MVPSSYPRVNIGHTTSKSNLQESGDIKRGAAQINAEMAVVQSNDRILCPVNLLVAREILPLGTYSWEPNTAWINEKGLIIAAEHLHMRMSTHHDPCLV